MADELCPDCGSHLGPAVGMGWLGGDGRVRPWVVGCLECSKATGEDHTFGLDEQGRIVGRVDAVMLDEYGID